MSNVEFSTLERWKKDCLESNLSFLQGKSDLSDRDKDAYRAGFMQGWAELRNTLSLHCGVKIDMQK
jgi:hypothetical protein